MTDHVLVDGRAGRYVWTFSPAYKVCLTVGLTGFFKWAMDQGLCPVVVTNPDGRLSFPALLHLLGRGGLWLCKVDGGYRDMRSGMTYERIEAVPQDPEDTGMAFPVIDMSHIWVYFSVIVQHAAVESTVLGAVTEVLWNRLIGESPAGWGGFEPCLVPWNRDMLTQAARSSMPAASMVVTSGGQSRMLAVSAVRRTNDGLEEIVSGFAVTSPASVDMNIVGRQAVEVLRGVAEAVSVPIAGLLGACHGGSELWFETAFAAPILPLALLAGPRTLRDLCTDARSFSDAHGGTAVGRGKFPSVVIPLLDEDVDMVSRVRGLIDQCGLSMFMPPQDNTRR